MVNKLLFCLGVEQTKKTHQSESSPQIHVQMHLCAEPPDSGFRRYQNRYTSWCGQTEQQHRTQLANTHWNNQWVSSGRAQQASRMKWTLSLVIFVTKQCGPIGSLMDPLFTFRYLWRDDRAFISMSRHQSFESYWRQYKGEGCTYLVANTIG